MSWYVKSQEKLEIKKPDRYKERDTAIGQYPGADATDEAYRDFRSRRRDWVNSVLKDVALGKRTIQDAEDAGASISDASSEHVKPLPPILYHVTTAKDKVLQEGLKTRNELNMGSGVGLGGGTDNTVSFTTDIDVAENIKYSLLEAKRVASGELTLQQMIDMAKKGTGAKHEWYSDILGYYGGMGATKRGKEETMRSGEIPMGLQYLMRGVARDSTIFGLTDEQKKEGWYQDPNDRFTRWKKLTPEEIQDQVFSFYKSWALFRAHAGGPEDPIFFGSDSAALARVPDDQIAVLQYKAKPNSFGYQKSGLGEWRTWTGQALELQGVIE